MWDYPKQMWDYPKQKKRKQRDQSKVKGSRILENYIVLQ